MSERKKQCILVLQFQSKKRRNPCCALPRSRRVARSTQEGGTTLCIHFLHGRQKSKGQCDYSIFSSSVTKGREFCIDFCPKVHKSQAPTEPFSALGPFNNMVLIYKRFLDVLLYHSSTLLYTGTLSLLFSSAEHQFSSSL